MASGHVYDWKSKETSTFDSRVALVRKQRECYLLQKMERDVQAERQGEWHLREKTKERIFVWEGNMEKMASFCDPEKVTRKRIT